MTVDPKSSSAPAEPDEAGLDPTGPDPTVLDPAELAGASRSGARAPSAAGPVATYSSAGSGAGLSLSDRQPTNCSNNLSETSWMTPRPNCAGFPVTDKSV